MLRTGLLLTSAVCILAMACGVALAAFIDCANSGTFCVGTKKDDKLNGSEGAQEMYGQAGNDEILGNGGGDELLGGLGNDTIRGGEGDDYVWDQVKGTDKVYGEGGADTIFDTSFRRVNGRCVDDRNLIDGGEGNDTLMGQTRLYGGLGDDVIDGSYVCDGTKRVMDGGPGNDRITSVDKALDTIYVQDGESDEVSCGPAKDTVYYDEGIDSVNPATCERRITEPTPAPPTP